MVRGKVKKKFAGILLKKGRAFCFGRARRGARKGRREKALVCLRAATRGERGSSG